MKVSRSLLAALPLLAACASNDMGMKEMRMDGVAYDLEFTPMWSAQSHPLDYPAAGVLSGPHFSGLIGACHVRGAAFFGEGRTPSPGLERLSEMGAHSPLDAEIDAAIAAGDAGERFESGAIKDLMQPLHVSVHVSPRFPLVSFAAMIAPSPDWFAGVADVELMEDGQWVATKDVIVYAWDSGGDSGTTYEAADTDLQPKGKTQLNDAPHFLRNGTRVPVAKVTLRKR